MKKTILICGATGFIGKNLLFFFYKQKKYKIKATYFKTLPLKSFQRKVKWVKADLRKIADVKKSLKNVDIVLQFAATTSGAADIISRPYIHVTDNVVMNSLILKTVYDLRIKHFIFPSCTVMYQNSKKPLSEKDFNESLDLNENYFGVGNTKVYLEKMCKFFSKFNKTKFTVIRHSNIYGPFDKYNLQNSHMFGATITKVLNNNDKITIWGSGKERRDLLYVSDLVNFIQKAITRQKNYYELFNVGFGKDYSVIEVVKKIIKISGSKPKIEHDLAKPNIPTYLSLNCSKANKKLGWKPKVSLEQGIKKTIIWYKKNYK